MVRCRQRDFTSFCDAFSGRWKIWCGVGFELGGYGYGLEMLLLAVEALGLARKVICGPDLRQLDRRSAYM